GREDESDGREQAGEEEVQHVGEEAGAEDESLAALRGPQLLEGEEDNPEDPESDHRVDEHARTVRPEREETVRCVCGLEWLRSVEDAVGGQRIPIGGA